jgi:uncharacterized protein
MDKKVVITGGTGLIGRALCRELAMHGYCVVVLSRETEQGVGSASSVTAAHWDLREPGSWLQHADGALAVVNLAGDNIASSLRWSRRKKDRILDSRLSATRAVAETIYRARHKPRVVVQGSAIGFYGPRNSTLLDETSPGGAGFLADVARQWEAAADALAEHGVRTAIIRTGIVLAPGSGFLQRAALPFRLGLGGHPGSGRQWLSWIHLQDEVRAIRFLIEHPTLAGPFNLTAPAPLPAREFFRELGRALHRPAWLPVPALALRLALGELARELLLSGQRVRPARLLEAGFRFAFPEAGAALADVYPP